MPDDADPSHRTRPSSVFVSLAGWPRRHDALDHDPLREYRTESHRVWLTQCGRTAIDLAFQSLGLKPGDEILLPAYGASCEIDVALRHHLAPRWYDATEQGLLDLARLDALLTPRTRALYVVHPFGFPQPIDAIATECRRRGLHLVEDCAHALFARGPAGLLGTFGDVSLFSLQKPLGLPDGGLLILNRRDLPAPPPLRATGLLRSARLAARPLAFEILPRPVLRAVLRAFHAYASRRYRPGQREHMSDDLMRDWMVNRAMSAWSSRLLRRIDPARVVATRRRHFERLLARCPNNERIRPLFSTLPEGVVPLLFPVLCRDREAIQRAMARRGITTYRWWSIYHPAVNWSEFPAACALKERVLALPVHHELDAGSLDAMIAALDELGHREGVTT